MNRVLLTLLALLTGLSVPHASAEARVVGVDQAAVGSVAAGSVAAIAAVPTALSRPYARTIAHRATDAPLAQHIQVALTTTVQLRIDRAHE